MKEQLWNFVQRDVKFFIVRDRKTDDEMIERECRVIRVAQKGWKNLEERFERLSRSTISRARENQERKNNEMGVTGLARQK